MRKIYLSEIINSKARIKNNRFLCIRQNNKELEKVLIMLRENLDKHYQDVFRTLKYKNKKLEEELSERELREISLLSYALYTFPEPLPYRLQKIKNYEKEKFENILVWLNLLLNIINLLLTLLNHFFQFFKHSS